MRLITLEEHFTTVMYQELLGPALQLATRQPEVNSRLLDLGTNRIQSMDQAGVDVQILSFTGFGVYDMPLDVGGPICRDANIQASEAMKAFPTRFGAFASLPMQDPIAAAKELEYCVETLGFVGAMVDGMIGGQFLDNPKFYPVFQAATALDVPIYLHPAPPPGAVRRAYTDDLVPPFNFLLSTAVWGWHVETGLHALRMMMSGLFDRFPTLKIILGHMGENLPYSIVRADSVLNRSGLRLDRSPLEVFQQNFWITTSGYFSIPPVLCANEILGSDRILLSVDYPFSDLKSGREMLGLLESRFSILQVEGYANQNATSLLKLQFEDSPT